MKKITALAICFSVFSIVLFGQNSENKELKIVRTFEEGAFLLTQEKVAPPILIDTSDAPVVSIAAKAVASDIELISGAKPEIITNLNSTIDYLIIAGTIGHSSYIDTLIKSGKIEVSEIKNKWESFIITTINSPMKDVKQALVVAGSDKRGTAYGLFELSRIAGVSPWIWWADVVPEQSKILCVLPGTIIMGEPSIKYRGIFLNDEDWGLKPWAANNMDTDIQDIGPKTYAYIFELLLRLRANYIWPAMHECTKSFYYYPENPKVADEYAIVVGSSHCEPMLRCNVFEWTENFENEYGIKPGEWRYDVNKSQIYRYWDDRIKVSHNYESVYTVGMRGVHDSGMPGPKDKTGKVALMDTVIQDQRKILQQYFKHVTDVPQIFCPYKEVLGLYQSGLKLPDDITLVWCDDNHGYIRQLSTPTEQKRSGGSGVYYHLSYWGSPQDYLWISTISPALISYEMTKAWQYDAKRLWIANVGDIKPGEMETQFFLDMAWDVNKWTPEKAQNYAEYWAEQTFGKEFALEIATIKNEYFRLTQNAKPEHQDCFSFTERDANERLNDYAALTSKVQALATRIPARLTDAFFELIYYPVTGAALMNQKILYARKSLSLAKQNDTTAFEFGRKAQQAFNEIVANTQKYNQTIANGKWNGMMSYNPRNLTVFDMPVVATRLNKSIADTLNLQEGSVINVSSSSQRRAFDNSISIPAGGFSYKKEVKGETIETLQGLGLGGNSISRMPSTATSFPDSLLQNVPYVDYNEKLTAGAKEISLKCLPTHGIHAGRGLRMAVSVNNQTPQVVNVNNPNEDTIWRTNVLRGFSEVKIPVIIDKESQSTIRIYLLDTGLVLSRIDITPK